MAARLEQIANYLEQNELKSELDAENKPMITGFTTENIIKQTLQLKNDLLAN